MPKNSREPESIQVIRRSDDRTIRTCNVAGWSDARIAELRQQLARTFPSPGFVVKVIAGSRRGPLGISARQAISAARRGEAATVRQATVAVETFRVAAASGCRFPLWAHREGFGSPLYGQFCGKPRRDAESPYCEEHHARCYNGRWRPGGSANA